MYFVLVLVLIEMFHCRPKSLPETYCIFTSILHMFGRLSGISLKKGLSSTYIKVFPHCSIFIWKPRIVSVKVCHKNVTKRLLAMLLTAVTNLYFLNGSEVIRHATDLIIDFYRSIAYYSRVPEFRPQFLRSWFKMIALLIHQELSSAII